MILQDLISRGGGGGGDQSLVGPDGVHGDLTGLPTYLRSGLIAMAIFGLLSLLSATGLFLYISYRLLKWHYYFKHQQSRRRSLEALEAHCSGMPDYTLGLPQLNSSIAPNCYVPSQPRSQSQSPSPCPSFSDYHNQFQQHLDAAASTARDDRGKKKHKLGHKRHTSGSSTKTSATNSSLSAEVATNPFLLLIYNLLLADMIQAASFSLSVSWLRYDATYSGSVTCWLQGWLSTTGKLSASACLVFASGLTYMTVVRGYRASPRALYISIGVVWLFTYVLAGAGVAITHNGRRVGGWFSWSNGWVSLSCQQHVRPITDSVTNIVLGKLQLPPTALLARLLLDLPLRRPHHPHLHGHLRHHAAPRKVLLAPHARPGGRHQP